MAKILEATDRGNPCGKRDYAIILAITRLGLRGIDVKRLRFGDLDWPGNRLSVVQAKTGRRMDLPLLKDVGWAIIDYIRSGRPRCDCPEVFIRHTAPIGPFSDQDHLHQILVKHARVAHVRLGEERRHGMHSLRHTLATRLLEDGTPIEQIARRAEVSVTLLYADAELAQAIATARERQRQAGRDRAWRLPARVLVTEQSVRADLANAKEQVRRLTEEVELLRGRLARDLGAQADLARGRIDGLLLDQLERRAAELEAENCSLRPRIAALEIELHDLGEDLQAARAMNRELMAGLNRASSSQVPTRRPRRP